MASSKLLKEAIADAKAVRETALANAKIQLEEAFTPRLKSMLSQKLRAEAEDMADDKEEEDERPQKRRRSPVKDKIGPDVDDMADDDGLWLGCGGDDDGCVECIQRGFMVLVCADIEIKHGIDKHAYLQ